MEKIKEFLDVKKMTPEDALVGLEWYLREKDKKAARQKRYYLRHKAELDKKTC